MVSLSKLLNNGLLFSSQSVFLDLATPQQAAVEQYNIINFLGGSAPYKQRTGVGILPDIPQQCEVQQVHLLSRHGERYPSLSDGRGFQKTYQKIKAFNGTLKGSLAFFNDYTYFVEDNDLYEKETSERNSQGLFAGTTDALRHGVAFRAKYGKLFNDTELPVFSSNSGRCFQTSEYFARGFLGDEFEKYYKHVIIDEDGKMGANSLTPRYGCASYNSSENDAKTLQYDTTYLDQLADRIEKENPGLGLKSSDVGVFFGWCAFELNVRGSLPVCDIFTNDELIHSSYSSDLGNYYGNGPGNSKAKAIGSPLLEAQMKLLKDDDAENKLWLSFTHDTDLELYYAALGLMVPEEDLPVDHVPLPSPYSQAEIVPQGARIYIEKLRCGDDSYIRFIVNDAVVPLKGCTNGPGFSCRFSDFEDHVDKLLGGASWADCDAPGPQELSFYWDYKSVNYDADLINQ